MVVVRLSVHVHLNLVRLNFLGCVGVYLAYLKLIFLALYITTFTQVCYKREITGCFESKYICMFCLGIMHTPFLQLYLVISGWKLYAYFMMGCYEEENRLLMNSINRLKSNFKFG